jgi:hypothetical protein
MLQPHPQPQRALVGGLTAIIAVGMLVGGLIWWQRSNPVSNPVSTLPASAVASDLPTTTAKPSTGTVTLYYEVVKFDESTTDQRRYPTYTLYKAVSGSSKSEELANIGGIGQYPTSFELSHDKKTLYINTEKKVQALDLGTKKLTDVVTAKSGIGSIVLSPDDKDLLIWDEEYATSDTYTVRRVNLATKSETTVLSGKTADVQGSYILEAWRSDNKVLLMRAQGEVSHNSYLDLATKKITDQESTTNAGILSQDNTLFTVIEESVDDICNNFSVSAFSTRSIIDRITEKQISSFGNKDRAVNPLAFSNDNSEVLYTESTPWTKAEDCSKTPTETYYKTDVQTGKNVTKVTDVESLLKTWNQPSIAEKNLYTAAGDASGLHEKNIVAQYTL